MFLFIALFVGLSNPVWHSSHNQVSFELRLLPSNIVDLECKNLSNISWEQSYRRFLFLLLSMAVWIFATRSRSLFFWQQYGRNLPLSSSGKFFSLF